MRSLVSRKFFAYPRIDFVMLENSNSPCRCLRDDAGGVASAQAPQLRPPQDPCRSMKREARVP